MDRPILLVVGTRPEGIKLAPVYLALKSLNVPVILCATNQHTTLLNEVFSIFDIVPDVRFDIMKPGQDLFYLTATLLEKMKECLAHYNPQAVIVQGDTTTAYVASVASFYKKIPVYHVEAGLRSKSLYEPFPEEFNRRSISLIATGHFAPTHHAFENLRSEGVALATIAVTGNPVVDAYHILTKKIESGAIAITPAIKQQLAFAKEHKKLLITFTVHRRESFGDHMQAILQGLKNIIAVHPDAYVIFPCHPNPHVQHAIDAMHIRTEKQIYLCDPLPYSDFIHVLDHSDIVITDSGGVCEEATTMGKKTIIVRNRTERIEALSTGCALLSGTQTADIVHAFESILNQPKPRTSTIFGDGHAAKRIAHSIAQRHFSDLLLPNKLNNTVQI